MKLFSILFFFISAAGMPLRINSQIDSLTGLWKINKVMVGDEEMSPVAKWTRIHENGTFESGNGWLKISEGTWSFDREDHIFKPVDPLDVKDEFGGFVVSFEKDQMRWKREEEGMDVEVTLVSVKNIPMAPADYLEGLWDLAEITDDGVSVLKDFDPEDKHRLFIRWDRIYVNINPDGERSSGYWHIHAHKPELTLLSHVSGVPPEGWIIEVELRTLQMTGISESNKNIIRSYTRRDSF